MAAVQVQFPLLVVWYWGMGITLEIAWLLWLWKIICQTISTPRCEHSFTVITCILLFSGVFLTNQKICYYIYYSCRMCCLRNEKIPNLFRGHSSSCTASEAGMAAVQVQFPLLVVSYWGMGITLEIAWLLWLWKIICQTIYTPACDHSFTVITCILLFSGVFLTNQKIWYYIYYSCQMCCLRNEKIPNLFRGHSSSCTASEAGMAAVHVQFPHLKLAWLQCRFNSLCWWSVTGEWESLWVECDWYDTVNEIISGKPFYTPLHVSTLLLLLLLS
jgi:hypothetical protein